MGIETRRGQSAVYDFSFKTRIEPTVKRRFLQRLPLCVPPLLTSQAFTVAVEKFLREDPKEVVWMKAEEVGAAEEEYKTTLLSGRVTLDLYNRVHSYVLNNHDLYKSRGIELTAGGIWQQSVYRFLNQKPWNLIKIEIENEKLREEIKKLSKKLKKN